MNFDDCRIEVCKFKDIRHIFEEFHYKKGHMGGGISTCLRMIDGDNIVGGMVIGKPRHGGKYPNMLEIRRMALLDSCPKNSESWFLGKALRWLRDHTDAENILSYADGFVGHKGTIYKASNFKLVGTTAPSKHIFWRGVRYHPRSLSIDRPYSYALRDAVKDGTATIETGDPKSIYIYKINRKRVPPKGKYPPSPRIHESP
jgi:hypothetical protein